MRQSLFKQHKEEMYLFDTPTAFFEHQHKPDVMRFVTCGSEKHGKSTLVARLLFELKQLTAEELVFLEQNSIKSGTQGIDYALLLDCLPTRFTQDVVYRYFATNNRKFIVADTPGHAQYPMLTGAASADVAVILIDALEGVQIQTRRHACLVSSIGIRHLVLAINKMDMVDFDPTIFEKICLDFNVFANKLNFDSITAIPLSALKGDNLLERSVHTHWYTGPTLMDYLETVKFKQSDSDRLVFTVQQVNQPDTNFHGFSGILEQGSIKTGDDIRITASGQHAKVADIVTLDGSILSAPQGQSVTLVLDQKMDALHGDIISHANNPLQMTDQFEATLVWLNEAPGLIGRNYDLKLATQWVTASISSIKYTMDVNTLAHDAARQLTLNDIGVCNLFLNHAVTYDNGTLSKILGRFILVDKFSHATLAVGMIRHSLRRADNVHKQFLSIGRAERQKLNGYQGQVIWFTGLSGSGKSTIANALEIALYARGYRTFILDGDNVRGGLNKDLGFTDADRVENIRRIAEVAKLMMDAGLIVITSFISPFRGEREMARELIGTGHFLEVYVDTTLMVCEQRDVKGLYKKARAGQLPNMTGIGSAYEAPLLPDCKVGGTEPIEEAVNRLLAKIITPT